MGIDIDKLTEKKFAELCKDSGKKYTITEWFYRDFRELSGVLDSLTYLKERT